MRDQFFADSGTVDRNGVRVHYEVHGAGDVTILLPPAWAIVDGRLWHIQVETLSDRYRTVTFDPRGNGRSDRPTDPAAYTTSELVQDVVSVLDAVGADTTVIVGNSFGCVLAYLTAALHPERVSGMILINGCSLVLDGRDNDPIQRALATFDNPPAGHDSWALLNAYWLEHDYERFVRFFIRRAFPEPGAGPFIDDAVQSALQTTGEVLAAAVRARGNQPVAETARVLRSMAEQITAPALVLHGELDRISPLHRDHAIAQTLHAPLAIVEGAGHCPQATRHDRVNAAIDWFVATRLADSIV